MQMRIPYTAFDHHILPKVKELFTRLFKRRLLIRLVGLRFSHLVRGGHQIHLFEDSQEAVSLYQSIDKIRKRFGDDKIQRAVSNGHEMRSFNPFKGSKK